MKIKNANKLVKPLILSLLSWVSPNAATIVVNSGSSIQTAINSASAGDTISVNSGTYSETISFSNSGTFAAPIVLKATINGGAIIDGTGLTPSGRQGLITIKNKDYIQVEGFEIRNYKTTGNPTPVGILIEGSAQGIKLLNNEVHHIENNKGGTSDVGAHGIGVFGTTTAGIRDLLIVANKVHDNILMSSEAFVLNGNVYDFKVLNNEVYDNNNIGFDFIGFEGECSCTNDFVRDGIVKGNLAKNNRSDLTNTWYEGEASAGGFYVDGGSNIIFESNVSTGNNLGIEVASEHKNKFTKNVILRNNWIYKNTELGIAIGGYNNNVGSADSIFIINNTLFENKGWGTEIVFQYKITNTSVINNIIIPKKNNEAVEFAQSNDNSNTWSNNLYYNGDAGLGSISTANPQLVDAENGIPTLSSTSPAIDMGIDVSSLQSNEDLNGDQRISGSKIDLGAVEYFEEPVVATKLAKNFFSRENLSSSIKFKTQQNQLIILWGDSTQNNLNSIVYIRNLSGATVKKVEFKESKNNVSLVDLRHLKTGRYFVDDQILNWYNN